MTIYELEGLATPGPWAVIRPQDGIERWDGIHYAHVQFPDRENPSTKTEEANAVLVAHCRNNFLQALAELKEEHELRVSAEDVQHSPGFRCSTCALIAELEEVK